LDLLAGGVVDLDGLAAFYPSAGFAVRAQPCETDLAGKAHIRAAVAERDDLVIKSRRPQVGVVGETRRDVVAVVR
jgi:hypothetical protein